jgi:hypothetical protein
MHRDQMRIESIAFTVILAEQHQIFTIRVDAAGLPLNPVAKARG